MKATNEYSESDSDSESDGGDVLGDLRGDDSCDIPFDDYEIPSITKSSTPISSSHGLKKSSKNSAGRRRSVEASSGRRIFPVRNPTKQDLIHARQLLQSLQKEFVFTPPDRGNLDDPSILWKEGKPDYTIADLHYFLGKTKNHPPGSIEMTIENLIKTWEMEATHKEFYQWTTVDKDVYEVQANGGKVFGAMEAPWVGNYNWLLSSCKKDLYDYSKETFESSHGKFRYAFPEGFPFEVLEVFSGPPKVSFSWNHWATFSGEYNGHKGNGETIRMTGFGVALLNDQSKIQKLEIYFNPNSFLEALTGQRVCKDGKELGFCVREPIASKSATIQGMLANLDLEKSQVDDDQQGETTSKEGSKSRCPFSGASL